MIRDEMPVGVHNYMYECAYENKDVPSLREFTLVRKCYSTLTSPNRAYWI